MPIVNITPLQPDDPVTAAVLERAPAHMEWLAPLEIGRDGLVSIVVFAVSEDPVERVWRGLDGGAGEIGVDARAYFDVGLRPDGF